MVLLTDAIDAYLLYIKHQQKVARSTYLCYASWLHHLQKWLVTTGYGDAPDATVFNAQTLTRYLVYLSAERKHRPRTLHGAFLPIRGLAKMLCTNGTIASNPMDGITLPKKDAAIRLLLTDQDIEAMLDGCRRQRNPKTVAMASAVMHLLVFGGLRSGELLNLRLGDVSIERDSEHPAGKTRIFVACGKGSKSRTVFAATCVLQAVQHWLTFRPTDCTHNYLFSTDRVRPMQRRGFDTLWDSVVAAAGMQSNKAAMPHACRHWRACDLLKSGADLKSIQAFTGHASLQALAAYLHIEEERCRNLAYLTQLPSGQPKPEPKEPQAIQPRPAQRIRRSLRLR
jgi:site-specific recombinase XerD